MCDFAVHYFYSYLFKIAQYDIQLDEMTVIGYLLQGNLIGNPAK